MSGIASCVKLCDMPEERFRNHRRIRLIRSEEFPNDDRPRAPVAFHKGRLRSLFPKHSAKSDRRTTIDETAQIPKWIFDQEEQQV